MSDFRDRFQGMEPEQRDRLVEELEAQVTVRGSRLLGTPEIEDLLTLLPAAHFRLAFRAGLNELKHRREEFPEKVADFKTAVDRLAQECCRVLASTGAQEKGLFLDDMGSLRLVHPALWYRVYQEVRRVNLGWALELEPADRWRPFKKFSEGP